MNVLHLDIETYSNLDLPEVGLYRYAKDPSTEVLMIAWAINEGPVELFDFAHGWPGRLRKALSDPRTTVCAFNAAFERVMLRDTLHIDIPIHRWHCTLVHGLGLGFSGGLGAMAQAVGVDQQKMEEGRKLIQRFSKPQPVNRKVARWTRDNDPEGWALFGDYCRQDVETERALQRFFDQYPLPGQIWTDWELDQLINDRGMPVDRQLVDQALRYADETRKDLLDELHDLTGLQNPNSNAQLLTWLQDQGLDIDNLQAATVARKLKSKSTGPLTRRVLELKQQLAKSSVSKFDAFAAATGDDNRIRGTLQYLGASRTGRWAGRLVQVQNFPRPPKGINVTETIHALLAGTPIDNPLHGLSAALRGVFKAGKGKTLVVADLAGIEGRVLPWLCDFDAKLDAIAAGQDMYKVAAAGIYRIDYDAVNDEQRTVGKVCELALGYQGGVNALNTMANAYGLPPYSDIEGQPIVNAWRAANKPITQFWSACQRAARLAIRNKNKPYAAGKLVFVSDDNFLQLILPSGRILYYYQPEQDEDGISYMGMNQYTRKWERTQTYGGKFCIAQGTLVLTDKGLVPIEDVTAVHRIWDGDNWVTTDGAIFNGVQETIKVHGVWMTENHLVLTDGGWQRASQSERYNRVSCRLPNSDNLCRVRSQKIAMESSMRLRKDNNSSRNRTDQNETTSDPSILWLQKTRNYWSQKQHASHVQTSCLRRMAKYGRSLPTTFASCLAQLRSTWHLSLQNLERLFRELLDRYGAYIPAGLNAGSHKQQRPIFSGELSLDYSLGSIQQHTSKSPNTNTRRFDDSGTGSKEIRDQEQYTSISNPAQLSSNSFIRQTRRSQSVYDLINCGPRNRFVVLDEQNQPLIVHNCENATQATSRDILAHGMQLVEQYGFQIVGHVHDEIITEQRPAKKRSAIILSNLMSTRPPWAPDLPLAAQGFEADRYRK